MPWILVKRGYCIVPSPSTALDDGEDEEESLRQHIFGTPTVDQISLFLRSIANSIDTFQRYEQQHDFGCGVKIWGIENQVDISTQQICPYLLFLGTDWMESTRE